MKLVTLSSSTPPVTLGEVKTHLRVDGTALDSVLSPLIDAAADFVERETRQTLAPATFRLYLDGFPDDRELKLPRFPLRSVASIKYLSGGVEQTLGPSAYTVDPSGSTPGRVTLNSTGAWPAADDVANSVRIQFDAGYEDDAPLTLKTAVAMLAGYWLEVPTAALDRRIDEMPLSLQSIIWQHRFPEVA